VRAEGHRSRAVARRPFAAAAVVLATTGAALAFAAAPAGASDDFKPQPHADTATTTTDRGHGHAHSSKPAAHGSKHTTTTTSGGGTVVQPRTVTQTTTGPAIASRSGSWAPPAAAPEPAVAPTPASAPTSKPAAASGHSTNWQREDSEHSDKGVVRAFASDLRHAGKSAGFPIFLVGVMAAFLLVQHRLDKRDVKLSQADWASDQGLEFSAPATIRR